MNLSYSKLIHQLFNMNKHLYHKVDLSNCLKLDALLNFPSQAFASIHVAGTNGKGSTCLKIAKALQACGKKVGLYTSPHISCFRERIRINDEMISETATETHLQQLFRLAEQNNTCASFFEFTTLLAFQYFSANQIDIAVIETGLGGRLDATNIITPILSVITSISLDHTEILGNTIDEIAIEKAGIIKPQVPVVLGPRVPIKTIQPICELKKSPCIHIKSHFDNFHAENCAIAKQALETLNVPQEHIKTGLQSTPKCRTEIFLPNDLSVINNLPAIVLDVAHNPDGMQHLAKLLSHRFPGHSIIFVVGLSLSKDLSACLEPLTLQAKHFFTVEANNQRAAPQALLAEELQGLGVKSQDITALPTITSSVTAAIALAAKEHAVVVVCGSFFIMSEARKAIGIQEPSDEL